MLNIGHCPTDRKSVNENAQCCYTKYKARSRLNCPTQQNTAVLENYLESTASGFAD